MDAKVKLTVDSMMTMSNIADHLDDETCKDIARQVKDGYVKDAASRADWEKTNAEAFKLALQVVERKSEPWVGCSNVKFPLVTVACLHYHARAYPLLVNDNDLVKAKVFGPDADGSKSAQADRIGKHMTWQCLEQMPEWEAETDKGLLIQPLLGMFYKKTAFDPVLLRNRSDVVSPKDLVINYWTKCDINESPRATHVIQMFTNDIYERVARGVWCNHGEIDDKTVEEESKYATEAIVRPQHEPLHNEFTAEQDKATRMVRPPVDDATPIDILEQICWYDLDDDGYKEPYIVVIERETGRLRRIVSRWSTDGVYRKKDGAIIKIVPDTIYVKYGFIPAPDGSYYDLGFGRLLGPLNDAVDTALNQLIDCGTLMTGGGGFVGRGARMKSGSYLFKPYEWKQVDTIGSSLKENIVPLPIREPSQILFQLIGFLVSYAERIASANDLQVGENIGQNTPAATAQTMDQNGQRVFSGIFKRTWRSMRDEFGALFKLNRLFIDQDPLYDDLIAPGGMLKPQDYDAKTTVIRPAADPTVVSEMQKQKQNEMTMGLAFKMPGFNRYKSVRRYLEGMRVPAIDEIFPPPPPTEDGKPGDLPSPPDPKMEKLKIDAQKLKLDADTARFEQRVEAGKLQAVLQEIAAHTMEMQAKAVKALSEAKSAGEGQQIALINSAIGAYKHKMDHVLGVVERMIDAHKLRKELSDGDTTDGDNASGEGAVDGASGNTGLFTAPEDGAGVDANGLGGGGV